MGIYPNPIITTVAVDEDEILTGPEAAKVLKVHIQTVQALVRRGELRAAKVGRTYRIKRAWINEYLDRISAGVPA
jgi:excisionase family DNA binding protein